MTVAAVFLQVSDLHIGEIDPATGDATLSWPWAKAAATYSRFEGLLGHHARGLQELAKFCSSLRARFPKPCEFKLIVTGDITRCGGAREFEVAEEYLYGTIELRPQVKAGLRLSREDVILIPGNHDHWGGANFPLTGRASIYGQRAFRATPFLTSVQVGPRTVNFAAINSDCDVGKVSPSRFFARGKFLSELASAQLSLPPRDAAEIRICLIHHSLEATGAQLSMANASKAAFMAFFQNNNFDGMLTGHMHHFAVPSNSRPNSVAFREFRCGTTTQHDTVPYSWTNILGQRPVRNWPPNSLSVHLLDIEPARTEWVVESYGRLPNGFQSVGAQHSYRFPV